ncbi:MAG: ribonuclease III [Acidobacteriaceae bacterium]|nr:ribonuclease III [Acidobacteriaceae bacterium]
MAADLETLEARLGYQFGNRGLLRRALTHKSRAYEQGSLEVGSDNEQLEFLGDSILGFLVSEWLVSCFPEQAEGRLSKVKAKLVSASHLHGVARDLHLGQYLFLGRGEEMTGGREKNNLLADALEAVIAAIYLDGGMEVARGFVVSRLLSNFEGNADEIATDFKQALKNLAESMRLPAPQYDITESGPDHLKKFVAEVRIGSEGLARASGKTKKSASQEAARMATEKLRSLATVK